MNLVYYILGKYNQCLLTKLRYKVTNYKKLSDPFLKEIVQGLKTIFVNFVYNSTFFNDT